MLLTSSLSEFFEMCQFKPKFKQILNILLLNSKQQSTLLGVSPSGIMYWLTDWQTDHREERGKDADTQTPPIINAESKVPNPSTSTICSYVLKNIIINKIPINC